MFQWHVDKEMTLRLLEPRDAEPLYALIESCSPYLQEWIPWVKSQYSLEATSAFIRGASRQFAMSDGLQAGIWVDRMIAGVIGFNNVNWMNRSTSIGYWLGETFQGSGIMTKACRAFVHFAFDQMGMNRIEIECAVDNVRSRAIPEKLGFALEGRKRQCEWLNDRYADHFLYSKLAQG